MYKLALIFFFGILISQICFLHISSPKLIQPIYFLNANIPKLQVVAGSYWFVPIYLISQLYSKIIITYFKKWITYIALIGIPIFYVVLWFVDKPTRMTAFGYNIQYVLFYTWLIIAGYKFFKTRGKIFCPYISIGVLFALGLILYFIPDISFQSCKFPVKLPYCILSMLSISIIMSIKQNPKNNIFANLEKNALYYYLSQGIGASAIYYFAKLPISIWQIKLVICFVINLAITITLGLLFSLIYPKFEKIFIKNN